MKAHIDSITREVISKGMLLPDPPEGQEMIDLTPEQEARLLERGQKKIFQDGTMTVTIPQYAIDEENQAEADRLDRKAAIAIIKPLLQSAEGKAVTALTAAEVRALQAAWLWERGALDGAARVKPVGQWLRD